MSLLTRDPTAAFDLAPGEPEFLSERVGQLGLFRAASSMSPYPPLGGRPELLGYLRARHPGCEVVVTAGAKQALSAAFHAIRAGEPKLSSYRWSVAHGPPHWPCLPELAELGGFEFCAWPPRAWKAANEIRVVTSPNNPDGREDLGRDLVDVHDAAYAHEVYGWSGLPVKARCSVWSASKLLGMPGARVGWLVTEDPDLAARAAAYVEVATCGASVPGQLMVAAALAASLAHRLRWRWAREDLRANAALFSETVGPHVAPADNACATKGMFAWFRPADPIGFDLALRKAGVRMLDGSLCGAPGWIRASLGLAPERFAAAMAALRAALAEARP